jgi:hypothetical protein
MDLAYANKWKSLGVPVFLGKYKREMGKIKIVTEKIPLDTVNGKESEYDVSCLRIGDSPIVCIDVDNFKSSIRLFDSLMKANNCSIDDFVHERTRNGGYHLYFYESDKIKNILGKTYKGIHIDILFKGFVFTFPSSFNGKQYIPGNRSVASIKTIEEMGSVPEWLDDLMCDPDPKV